jgi:hypothetical protein
MGRSRFIDNCLSFEQTRFVSDLYRNTDETLRGLTVEQKRKALDLVLMVSTRSGVGCTRQIGERVVEVPYAHIDKENTTALIQRLAAEIGIIGGTLSLWEQRYQRFHYQLQTLSSCNLSLVENLNLGFCTDADLQEIMGKTPELKRVRMRMPLCTDKAPLLQFLAHCPKLEVLCLNTSSYEPDLLADILKQAANLKVLKLSHYHFSENDFQALKAKVADGSIHTLHFGTVYELGALAELIEAGKETLQGLFIRGRDVLKCEDAILNCKNLRSLKLEHETLPLTDATFKRLLQNNPRLEEISMYYLKGVTDASFETMEHLGRNLKRIRLTHSSMSDTAVREFAENVFWRSPDAEFLHIAEPMIRKGKELQFKLFDCHRRYWDEV